MSELLIVLFITSIISITFGTFLWNYMTVYSDYQSDANNFAEAASQTERISTVLRGIVDIDAANANELSAYAYFSPADTYTSLVHYYVTGKKIQVDVTRMTANPPNGTLVSGSTKTYTLVENYYQGTGASLFEYYDATGATLSTPVANDNNITQIAVNLSEPASHTTKGQQFTITVGLRNRKVNL